MDIFIKPVKKAVLTGRKVIKIKDVAEVYCKNGVNLNLGETIVYKIPPDSGKQTYLISVMDIVKAIYTQIPNASINNLGEMDTIVEYAPEPVKSKGRNTWDSLKIAFVCIVLFAGAMTAIMSFNSDAQIPMVFQNMYKLFFGVEENKPYIIFIPYSIGLAVGIIVFFNHFGGKNITKDPTPIEVEMTTYEKESIDCVIDNLSKEKENGGS